MKYVLAVEIHLFFFRVCCYLVLSKSGYERVITQISLYITDKKRIISCHFSQKIYCSKQFMNSKILSERIRRFEWFKKNKVQTFLFKTFQCYEWWDFIWSTNKYRAKYFSAIEFHLFFLVFALISFPQSQLRESLQHQFI